MRRPLTTKARKEIGGNPKYKICARRCSECKGRITIEHAVTYAGRRLDDIWSLIPLCEFHHAVGQFQDGGNLNKQENIRLALNQATDEELMKYPKANFIQLRDRLNERGSN